ncbi:hypothetical protein H6G74_06875 [Nostoc spongiaeforme FACHB-130]|uniref:Group-specific protein n=1 Tax=Nostoc spongiaeforme FACHB-130 TaxID=1357510 RepID=A0ABR8FRN2_9NOSO|nr:hypothetical protein [Nostoc spongiaeforme]MBD2594052.1 hypothetical protein [Nostoc spongiaeforme FACHB-130]
MGEKFVNYQIRCDLQQDVVHIVEMITRNQAYVSPSKNGWITVYDQASEEFNYEYIRYFAQELSEKLSTLVFTFIVNRGLNFVYLIYECGKIIDEFDNDISSEEIEKTKDNTSIRFYGDSRKLLKYSIPSTVLQTVSDFLESCRQRKIEYLGQDAIYELAPLVGIDTNRATIGYSYFEDNNLYIGTEFYIEEAEQFLLVRLHNA